MSKYLNTIITTTAISAIFMSTINAADNMIDYPSDYRTWTHVKSMVIQEGHSLHSSFGGIHHIYANDKAMHGYVAGTFPDGSIIIFDLLEADASDNAITEGSRKVVGVMHKDSSKFQHTASWGFEGFGAGNPDDRIVGENYEQACFSCHTSQIDNDYVFSNYRE